jgi:hypothetical protein
VLPLLLGVHKPVQPLQLVGVQATHQVLRGLLVALAPVLPPGGGPAGGDFSLHQAMKTGKEVTTPKARSMVTLFEGSCSVNSRQLNMPQGVPQSLSVPGMQKQDLGRHLGSEPMSWRVLSCRSVSHASLMPQGFGVSEQCRNCDRVTQYWE